MNAPVAAIERGDRRERPQTPWPLVQPLPSLVPKPTISPPINRIASDGANRVSTGPPTSATMPAPNGNPTTNAAAIPQGARSEEQPSELQSLMRNSYAVFS